MKRLTKLTFLFLLGLPVTVDAAQKAPKPTHLSRAQSTFRAADVDSSGKLEASELSRASISAKALGTWDADASGELSRDEFLMFYHHLLKNSGQVPGLEFDRESERITKLQKAEAKKRAEAARKKGTLNPKGGPEKAAEELSTVEKYRRAQAALDERIKKTGVGNAASSTVKQQLARRARGVAPAADETGVKPTAPLGRTESIRARLNQAQGAQADRARAGGVGREPLQRANSSLEDKAGKVQAAGGESALSEEWQKALKELDRKGALAGSSRARVQHSQESLTRRGRQAVGSTFSAAPTTEELKGLSKSAQDKLTVALGELTKRARSAGWDAEQFATERRRLVKRAKEVRADGAAPKDAAGESKAKDTRIRGARSNSESGSGTEREGSRQGKQQPVDRKREVDPKRDSKLTEPAKGETSKATDVEPKESGKGTSKDKEPKDSGAKPKGRETTDGAKARPK